MKNSGIEWIGEIPDSWDTLPLKRMVEKHFGGCWGEDSKNNDNDVLCIRIADFNFDNQSIKESAETMRNYTDAQIEKGLLKDGDLIVEKSGGGDKTPVGRVVIFDEEKFPQKAMFANFSECLRLKNTYSHRYIAYHLKSLYYSYDMRYYFHQTTGIQNLDMQEYLATMLCVPSVEQQCAIVETLDEKCGKIDELIANQQGQIEKLKEYKQSVITEAVTKGLDKSAPLKDSGIDWIGEIPENQGIARLKQWIKIINGYAFKSDSFQKEGDITVIRIGDIKSDIDFQNCVFYNQFNGQEQYLIRKNDILMAMSGATYGKITYISNDIQGLKAINQRVGIIRGKNNGYNKYIFQAKVFFDYLDWKFMGSAQPNISAGDILEFPVVYFDYETQKKIADYLDEKCGKIDEIISIKQRKIEKLQEYKKSLIYEYVTGKKEVV